MRNEAYFRRGFARWGLGLPLLLLNAALALAGPAVILETTRLVPTDGAPEGGYGRSVAIDGNIAVVGANGLAARAMVYTRSGASISGRPVFNTHVRPLPGFTKPKAFVF